MAVDYFREPTYAKNLEKEDHETTIPKICCFCFIKPSRIPILFDSLNFGFCLLFYLVVKEYDSKGKVIRPGQFYEPNKHWKRSKDIFLISYAGRLLIILFAELIRRLLCS